MEFNAEKITSEIILFIRDYYKKNNLGGAVIGLSGGKDSAVCLALMVKAIGSENVLALWLPMYSSKTDKDDAFRLAKMFNVSLKEFDLSEYNDLFISDIKRINKVSDDELIDVNINLKPRFRMLSLYAYAALMSKIRNKGYLVIGTSNKSERFVGYFTKGGDNVCDIAPLLDLYVDEVIKIGDYLGIPQSITHKTPDDGLSGVSDEEKLGFTYDDVKLVSVEFETGVKNNNINPKIREKIIQKHEANLHKFNVPYYKRKIK